MYHIMFQYCPSCTSKKIQFTGKKFFCPDCGFTYYHNTAAASGCVISSGGRVMLLTRGKEPALGKLDLPGGFVDPGEGVLEGLVRELREEIGWTPPIPPGKSPEEFFTLFASFPNTYPYKNIVYNTCDMFFTVSIPGLSEKDFHIEASASASEAGEIAGLSFFSLDEVKSGELAFDSTRRAIAAFREFAGRQAST